MRLLYIHQYFKTPNEPGGTRSYWIAKKLIDKGNEVTIITSSNKISQNKEIKNIDGIKVIYIKVPYNQKMNVFYRLISFVRFMLKSTYEALKVKNIDLVIATSTPLTIGFPALILKKIKKIPYLFEVRDLWPEVPIQMGALKNKLLVKLAITFEKKIYENSIHIIALSPGMKEGILKRNIANSKITVIPNMSKINEFWPREKNTELIKKLGLQVNSFKIIHFGSIGLANGVFTIIETAKLLKNNTEIEIIFIGGGSQETVMKKKCEQYNLKNVFFLGEFPMKTTSEIVNFCDVSIVSFLDLPILYTNSPNKLFDSLSAGKPIIVNSAGWTKELVENNGCGLYVNPNNPSDLVEKIHYLKSNNEILTKMGGESRKLAQNKYDKEILSDKFVEVINSIKLIEK
jgi:glycosyltransferase involved in cell wall biosynthesis